MRSKIYLTILCSVISISMMSAQRGNNKRGERIEAKKIAYITNAMDLTPEEAKVFWPIYNQHKSRMKEIRKPYKTEERLTNMEDKAIEKWIDNSLEKETKLLEEKKAYIYNLKKVISIRKIGLLYRSEKRFRKSILKEVKKRIKDKKKHKMKNKMK